MSPSSMFAEHSNTLALQLFRWLVAEGVNRETATELVQETLLRVWRKRDTLTEESLSITVLTILRNLCMDYHQRQKQRLMRQIPNDATLFKISIPRHLHTRNHGTLHKHIRCAIQTLNLPLRKTAHLFFEQHRPIIEIAIRTHVDESHVKMRLYHARYHIQQYLNNL